MGIMGAGSYLYITSSNYVLNSKFERTNQARIQIISTQNIISNVGMFFAAILMGYCAERYYSTIFIGVALLMLCIAIKLKPFDKGYYHTDKSDSKTHSAAPKQNHLYLVGFLAIALIGIMYSQPQQSPHF